MRLFYFSLADSNSSQSEVVLSDLIDSFKFSPTDKEIFWQMNSIATPTLADLSKDVRSQLPLIVERATV